jgi:membrane-bound lytic murein transglycosylase A
LPFFLEAELPRQAAPNERLQRLMIAQDTGSAILGPARADYFMGTGREAGTRAGLIRQSMQMTVLWPNAPDSAPA